MGHLSAEFNYYKGKQRNSHTMAGNSSFIKAQKNLESKTSPFNTTQKKLDNRNLIKEKFVCTAANTVLAKAVLTQYYWIDSCNSTLLIYLAVVLKFPACAKPQTVKRNNQR
jgi:hypothetical protein